MTLLGAGTTFTPDEVVFMAENESVTIVPSVPMPQLQLISGFYGPFRPPTQAEVPLWLAISLKKKDKCSIRPPAWLAIEHLQNKLEQERNHDDFSDLPFHHLEMAHLLLESASDDIEKPDTVRTLLKDIREVRQGKSRKGLSELNPQYLQINNLGLMEINEIRPFFAGAFNVVRKIASTTSHAAASQVLSGDTLS
ncbi:GINS complex, PSF2 component [Polychytrium aggregatum]|uniref:GINS complex, PSF2 component n=1 Tax=Polychytrium aggregatum TaxID=110093 RepID=UPI0022FF2D1F|nr:GINS complex, PSF2 component [Polychytrium aggregatum]KAI9205443.1 GINS complex, PSF2 component [Polychytrium aggregatum]